MERHIKGVSEGDNLHIDILRCSTLWSVFDLTPEGRRYLKICLMIYWSDLDDMQGGIKKVPNPTTNQFLTER
jgi:hypothetical protein